MIKLVAFDWNGTILSDTNAVVQTESVILTHYGLRPTNLKEFQNTYAVPFRIYWMNMGMDPKIFDRDALKIRKLFFKHYEPLEKFCRTRSGSREILKWLESKNIGAVIISNHPEGHIRHQLKRLKVDHCFRDILGYTVVEDVSTMHERGKDKQLKEYITQNKLKPKEVIIVGDTDEEIEIGKKYGYITVALTSGYQSINRLKAAKPDFIIHNLLVLKRIIKYLNTVKYLSK